MFDEGAQVLEEIEPEECVASAELIIRLSPGNQDKTRNEVLAHGLASTSWPGWDMAAAVANHLVKVDPETAGWWIKLAYSVRRVEKS